MKELILEIENLINQGLLEEAEAAIFANKDNIDLDIAGSMMSIIEFYRGNIDKAMSYVQKGLMNNINNGDLYFNMGLLYESKKEYNRAYLAYEQAIRYITDEEKANVIIDYMVNLKKNFNITVRNYSIILLTHNNLEYTKLCIKSIRLHDVLNNYEIIVVDNNSTDGTVEWLKQQEGIRYILNNENKGFPAGCNQGIKIANKKNDIFLLNNDTVLMQNSIFNLRMGLYSGEDVGATGATSNSVSNRQMISYKFDDFNDYVNYSKLNNICDESSYVNRIKLVGFAMFIRRDVLDKVGYLDERFTPGNFEDDDLSYRIIKEGYKLLLCKDSYIHHFGSITFSSVNQDYKKLMTTNSKKFKEKWGFSSEYSSNIRMDLINNIKKNKNDEFNVLEVGCACGATLLEIKNMYPNSNIYGIELNDNAAAVGRNFADIRSENIESSELTYTEKSFDYIILGDVLEHLVNPGKVLENLKRYLKDDGIIIASIPNVMHYSVIKNLINGRWKYEDSGILDKTHLRFFTKEEILELFCNSGFEVFDLQSINVVKEEDQSFINELKLMADKPMAEEYSAYQYLIFAQKIEYKLGISKKIRFLLRRIEMNIDVESNTRELLKYLQEEKASARDIYVEIMQGIVKKDEVAKYMIDICKLNKLDDVALELINYITEEV